MNNLFIFVFVFIIFIGIACYFYYDIFNMIYNEKIKPVIEKFNRTKNVKKNIVWTYIEDPIFYNNDYDIQLLVRSKNIPTLLKFCLRILQNKFNKTMNSLYVVTPFNVKKYLPDFPIEMNADSKYSIKFRVDLLAASLLEKYGGLFISPGTVVLQDLDEILYNLNNKYDLITFGGSIRNINSCNDALNPGNYIIAAKPNNPVIVDYRKKMLRNLYDQGYTDKLISEDLLSYSLQSIKPKSYFHFNCEYTGNVNNINHIVSLEEYFGYEPIQFKNKDNLIFIALPYDLILYDIDYKWVNNLSEEQFVEANTNITEIISKEVYKIK